jgi:hypothetical protein
MTEVTAPSLTPPVKQPKASEAKASEAKAKAPKEAKAKAPKEPKVKRPYKYSRDAIIRLVPDKEIKYRGQRAEWFEIVKAHDGKKVSEFNEAAKGRTNGKGVVQTPSGWLRFYVIDGAVTLELPAVAESEKTDATPKAE